MALDSDRREQLTAAAAEDMKDVVEALIEGRPATSDRVGELVGSWIGELEEQLARCRKGTDQ